MQQAKSIQEKSDTGNTNKEFEQVKFTRYSLMKQPEGPIEMMEVRIWCTYIKNSRSDEQEESLQRR